MMETMEVSSANAKMIKMSEDLIISIDIELLKTKNKSIKDCL